MEKVELEMSDSSELKDKLEQISRFISQDNPDEVLRILGELKTEYPGNKSVILNEPGILINAGGISKDDGKVRAGIHKAMVLVEGGLSDAQKARMHQYIANGHQILFSLESTKQLSEGLNNYNLKAAKHHFRQALKYDSISDLKANILVNYGNCLDSLGRSLEALYCYDDALKLKPEYSMAIGNRALARVFFANISGVFRTKTYIEAYQDIKSIMGKDDLISIGGSFAYETFNRRMLEIEGLFEDKSILEQQKRAKKTKPKFASTFEKEYTEFCREHKLFLNFHTGAHEDPDSILDSAFISIITPVDDNTTFYSLAKKINDIKEDFLVSKLLLFQSQFRTDDLNNVSKKVAFANTLDYADFSIYSALLKSAFRTCFNIFDKISFFINDYLGLGMKDSRIYFHTIWDDPKTKAVKAGIRATENISLFALYDMHLDLNCNKRLRRLRNSITHRKLTIYDSWLTGWDEKIDDENIGHETMLAESIKLMKLVRSAIIYMMNFVEIEENKKRAKLGGIVSPIFVDTEQFL